ncbi:Tyrosine-protein phosphatase non-receptor type substrate 1 [Chelonia mydas]|uniref:Tyrosine-protein phosphatase non-receptor type substrate 1 n=1 Tax=Chelonia mydas TaxID=8469 RepID=M7CJY2_CHEMY|nr:Tyrosine-protein phosphatase non-receptor type substrate 1 [Chelonia mydas]
MSHQTVGVILIYLQMTVSEKEIQILQSPAQVWLKSGDTAQLHCKTLEDEVSVVWYKEQSGSFQWIYRSSEFASSDGKYSSEVNTEANTFSLIIRNVQRDDSGVYYCGLVSFMYLQPNFGNGTRLIVTVTASEEEIQILQSPAQERLTPGQTAQLDCNPSKKEWSVVWYKEQQSGSLQWIYQSSQFATPNGKYSSKVDVTANKFSLNINNVQRNDSGVYYCGLSVASVYVQPNFGNGTRLIVTDASEPRLSILVPSAPEDAELPPIIPLLCLLSDFTPPWSEVLWDTGRAVQRQKEIPMRQIPQTAKLYCRISKEEWRVLWYKEQQNGSLHGIHQSSEFEPSNGKYSSKVNITANTFSLLISNVQRDDSGVYYCGLSTSMYLQPNFGNGTRLIVTAVDLALEKVLYQRESCAKTEGNTYEADPTVAASEEGIQILQRPAQLWLTSGQTAHLDCRISKEEWRVRWYKEQQNGSLHGIHQSSQSESLDGKYLSNVNITANTFSLLISNVQRDDSGVYYCGLSASVYLQPNFGNGTRLIVTDASEPSLSILVPSAPEDAELPPVIPLLCLLSDFTPPWSEVLWHTGEEASDSQTDAGAIDGDCGIVFYAGLPCIFILLLIQLLILLWRKCPIRADVEHRSLPIGPEDCQFLIGPSPFFWSWERADQRTPIPRNIPGNLDWVGDSVDNASQINRPSGNEAVGRWNQKQNPAAAGVAVSAE